MLLTPLTLPSYSDITIIGGGPVGAFLALRLEHSGHSVLLIEANDKLADDPRTLALSWGSVAALQQAGIWDATLPATAIHSVHVSQMGSLGRTLLHATELDLEALGYVVRYQNLMQAMQKRLKQSQLSCVLGTHVKQVTPLSRYAKISVCKGEAEHTLISRLVIIANGGQLTEGLDIAYHSKDYHQSAIISTLATETPHKNTAYERFTQDGSLALLPHQECFSLVWAQPPEQASAHLALDEDAFLSTLQKRFKDRAPQLIGVGKRYAFPLSLKTIKQPIRPNTIFIGNAAQTLHPIAGQGLNLGIRDALSLSRVLYSTDQSQVGTKAMLTRYRHQRRTDTLLMLGFTDLLVECFGQNWSLCKPLRSLGLALLDQNSLLKRQLGKKMIFGF